MLSISKIVLFLSALSSLAILCSTPVDLLQTAPNIQYPSDSYVFNAGESIESQNPAITNFTNVIRYFIVRLLPEGLIFNPENGTISGKPIKPQELKRYAIIANNEWGDGAPTIDIKVLPPPPLSFAAQYHPLSKSIRLT